MKYNFCFKNSNRHSLHKYYIAVHKIFFLTILHTESGHAKYKTVA